MKRIIGGKLYNTDTAHLLCACQSPLPRTDPEYEVEALYQRRKGELFFYRFGGFASRFARPTGSGEWTAGESIAPVTAAEAEAWKTERLLEARERFG